MSDAPSSPKAPVGDPAVRIPFDPRYIFSAVRVGVFQRVETCSHWDAIVFQADDPDLPAAVQAYLVSARAAGRPQRVLDMERVLAQLAPSGMTKRKGRKKP